MRYFTIWLDIHSIVNFPSSSFFVDASNNIGMIRNEDVDVTKAIELVAGVMAKVHVANSSSLVL